MDEKHEFTISWKACIRIGVTVLAVAFVAWTVFKQIRDRRTGKSKGDEIAEWRQSPSHRLDVCKAHIIIDKK